MQHQRWEQSDKSDQRKRQQRKSQQKEDQGARKGRKVAKHYICFSNGGSKCRVAKVAGRSPSGRMRDQKMHAAVARSTFWSQNAKTHSMFEPALAVEKSRKCTRLWHEANFEVKTYKAHHVRSTCGRLDAQKVHASVAPRTCGSQNARGRGDKHVCNSKLMVGTLLDDELCKKCTRPWRGAHSQVQSVKNWRSQTTFGRWDLRCWKRVRRCGAKMSKAGLEVKMVETHHVRTTFGRSSVVFRGRRDGFCASPKVSKTMQTVRVL